MARIPDSTVSEAVGKTADPLDELVPDYTPLMRLIGDARFPLLGEASHGTHEFYRERARITKRLIEQHDVLAVAIEGDWPDAARVNRYVRGAGDDAHADDALAGFRRFPTWMWRNTEVVEFVEWLRLHNEALPPDAPRVGFYGLDLYSLRASMEAVLRYLEKTDPAVAERARTRYACFDRFGDDPRTYGFLTSTGLEESCQQEVVEQLTEMLRVAAERARGDGRLAEDEVFDAVQNARLVKNAETYYRTMFLEEVSSWNLRDRHMAETFDALAAHLDQQGGRSKVVVWAHNSHVGDARATQMGERGELNVGQLARERYGRDAVLVGFTTHHGTVTAASAWGGAAERKRVRAALPGSYEAVFHDTKLERFF